MYEKKRRKYQVISYLEAGIKVLVDVPKDCKDPFQYAAEQGNKKAIERIFDLGSHNQLCL
jgi:hypothetical protein